ncbi:hypothetical protein INS49_002227 [Diaporthe citri]|uniref:uncharacterized protein n=1 Tax=Diaporthe citri TaxID=83186 RepID=UPI001C80FF67|nr:uncharacterized protein INS49_002227 [Diaporthe citri]KAG6368027.1 hypothetical protein INS49_002227 [Diaporthe citri]
MLAFIHLLPTWVRDKVVHHKPTTVLPMMDTAAAYLRIRTASTRPPTLMWEHPTMGRDPSPPPEKAPLYERLIGLVILVMLLLLLLLVVLLGPQPPQLAPLILRPLLLHLLVAMLSVLLLLVETINLDLALAQTLNLYQARYKAMGSC